MPFSPDSLARRIKRRLVRLHLQARITKYRLLSDCENVIGSPRIVQPVQMNGRGTIRFEGNVMLGYYPSPYCLSGYIYLEARSPDSLIVIGDGVVINNNSYIISDGPGIFVGRNTMISTHVEIMDSDFHDTHPDPQRRRGGAPKTGKVTIGENALINPNVRILRGSRIGNNAVIGNSSLVAGGNIPDNVVAMGNPARVVFRLSR